MICPVAVVRILAPDGSGRASQTYPLTGANLVVGRAPEGDHADRLGFMPIVPPL